MSSNSDISLTSTENFSCVLKACYDLLKVGGTTVLPALAAALPAFILDAKSGVPDGLAFTTGAVFISLQGVRSLLSDKTEFSHVFSLGSGVVAGLINGSLAASFFSKEDTAGAKVEDGFLYGSMPLLGAAATSLAVGMMNCCRNKCTR